MLRKLISGVCVLSLVFQSITHTAIKDINKTESLYFGIIFTNFMIDIILFQFLVLIFCYKKVQFKEIFSCNRTNKNSIHSDKTNTLDNLFPNQDESILLFNQNS